MRRFLRNDHIHFPCKLSKRIGLTIDETLFNSIGLIIRCQQILQYVRISAIHILTVIYSARIASIILKQEFFQLRKHEYTIRILRVLGNIPVIKRQFGNQPLNALLADIGIVFSDKIPLTFREYFLCFGNYRIPFFVISGQVFYDFSFTLSLFFSKFGQLDYCFLRSALHC